MTRLLLLLALGVIAFLLLRRFLTRATRPEPPPAYAPMVSCMSCGLHLPRDRAIEHNGRHYCCREHADQAAG
jgi:uncharacterized protein